MCMILAKKFIIIITVFGHNFMKNNFFLPSKRSTERSAPYTDFNIELFGQYLAYLPLNFSRNIIFQENIIFQ